MTRVLRCNVLCIPGEVWVRLRDFKSQGLRIWASDHLVSVKEQSGSSAHLSGL